MHLNLNQISLQNHIQYNKNETISKQENVWNIK